jgi:hypothetical protein
MSKTVWTFQTDLWSRCAFPNSSQRLPRATTRSSRPLILTITLAINPARWTRTQTDLSNTRSEQDAAERRAERRGLLASHYL